MLEATRSRWWTLVARTCKSCSHYRNDCHADLSRASLTDLDLRNNRLLEVRNLHSLPRLEHLNLGTSTLCIQVAPLTNIYRRQRNRRIPPLRQLPKPLQIPTLPPPLPELHLPPHSLHILSTPRIPLRRRQLPRPHPRPLPPPAPPHLLRARPNPPQRRRHRHVRYISPRQHRRPKPLHQPQPLFHPDFLNTHAQPPTSRTRIHGLERTS